MGFEELGALGELVGAIASVVLLAYIAIQIRHSSKNLEQNTRAIEASTRQAFTAQDQAYLCSALDPSVLAVAVTKLEAGEDLTPLELSQLIGRQHVNFRVFESAFSQHQRGVLDTGEWERYRVIIGYLLGADEPARQMWAGMRDLFHPDFIAEIETTAEPGAAGATCPSTVISGTGKGAV